MSMAILAGRLYPKSDGLAFLAAFGEDRRRMPLATRQHSTHFYDDEAALPAAVGSYLKEGLDRAEAAIVISTPAHFASFRQHLEGGGRNVAAMIETGQLTWLDAEETLERFMVGGLPDRVRFSEVVGGCIRSTLAGPFGRVRAYGEMVALLFARGHVAATLELEELWNELGREAPFPLFCAYPMGMFGASDDAVFHEVCRLHTDVVLGESWPSVTGNEDRRRIALLMQKGRRLEAEIEERTRSEQRLAILMEASDVLTSSLDYETTAEHVLRLVIPKLADFGFIDLVESEDRVRRFGRAHEDPRRQALLEKTLRARSTRPHLKPCALNTGVPGLHAMIGDAWLEDAAATPEDLVVMHDLNPRSMLTVPLLYRQRMLGALTLFYADSGRRYSEADLAFTQQIAHRAAGALENARLYGDLQEAVRKREEADKRKDEFLATLSHELRTPLNAILGWASMLRDDSLAVELRQRAVETIHRNAHVQTQIISDMLDVSRIIAGKLELNTAAVDLGRIIEAALDTVKHAAQAKGIRLSKVLDTSVGTVIGDPVRLQQVVWNLLTNAIKFAPARGDVTVRLEPQEGGVRIVVEDDGPGIPVDFLPHMFDRFRQSDSSSTRRHGGLGLGLAIARHLTELHGGSVGAQNRSDRSGAVLTVRLPLRPAAVAEPGMLREASGLTAPWYERVPSLAGVRVLVVDDDDSSRELVAVVLQRCGAEVRGARSSKEAFDVILRERPDVVLSDLEMPGEDGYALVRKVRALSPDPCALTPLAALTAYAGEDVRYRVLQAGFQAHTAKPVRADELVLTVAGLVGLTRPPAG
jgi:signal transduction histidine kinase/CheY-like chemotaxis protein